LGPLVSYKTFSRKYSFENSKLKPYRQVEQDMKEHYAKKAHQWAKGKSQLPRVDTILRSEISNHVTALKLLDPSITLILCGKNGHSDWDRYVLQESIQWIDMHSIHMYTFGRE
jgi:alpha-L-arabinofuranosidase